MIDKIELKPCLEEIILQLLPLAEARKCQLRNNLAQHISVMTNREAFLFVMKRLLTLIIHSSHNSTICISNSREGDKLSIIIQDDNNDYSGFISGKMEKHQLILKKAGCYLSFEFNEKKSITVILHFNDKKISGRRIADWKKPFTAQ